MSRCSLRRYRIRRHIACSSIVPIARAADRFYVVVFACDNNPPAAQESAHLRDFPQSGRRKGRRKSRPLRWSRLAGCPRH